MATAIGFAIMGFIGFFVKLIHIPINNIIVWVIHKNTITSVIHTFIARTVKIRLHSQHLIYNYSAFKIAF